MVTPISGSLPTAIATNLVDSTASQVDRGTPTDGTAPQSSGVEAASSSSIGLDKSLTVALAITGFRGEVDTTDPNQVIVRIVDDVTGATIVQIPSAGALAVAEALRKSAEDRSSVQAGALLDEAA